MESATDFLKITGFIENIFISSRKPSRAKLTGTHGTRARARHAVPAVSRRNKIAPPAKFPTGSQFLHNSR
jgi:hypothetical protein